MRYLEPDTDLHIYNTFAFLYVKFKYYLSYCLNISEVNFQLRISFEKLQPLTMGVYWFG